MKMLNQLIFQFFNMNLEVQVPRFILNESIDRYLICLYCYAVKILEQHLFLISHHSHLVSCKNAFDTFKFRWLYPILVAV